MLYVIAKVNPYGITLSLILYDIVFKRYYYILITKGNPSGITFSYILYIIYLYRQYASILPILIRSIPQGLPLFTPFVRS
jgi:hypothetical protein